MKLVVGLGNPGEKYQHNRHNIGFVVVDRLSVEYAVRSMQWEHSTKFFGDYYADKDLILFKPSTFMNDSGLAVASIARFYKLKSDDIYVVHDDLDITLGSYKMSHAKGPQIHNGLLSIYEHLGTKDFWHVRVGVENRAVRGNSGVPGVVYSLQDFTPPELPLIDQVIVEVTTTLKSILG
jgi:peptidyl-tRNA hydrolase, PTH1 family